MNAVKVSESHEDGALCCLFVPNCLLYGWHSTKRSPQDSYVEKLNMSIVDKAVVVRSCQSVEERIRVRVCRVKAKIDQASKREKQKIKDRESRLTIYEDEGSWPERTQDVSNLTNQIAALENKVSLICEESRKKDLALKKLREEKCELQMMSAAATTVDHGKTYDEVEERQKKRKVKSIRTAAEQALIFTNSFGLTVERVVLRSPNNELVELKYSSSSVSPSPGCSSSNDPSEFIDETLYLLEKFGVSDECYHELTQYYPQLPRSYKIKNIRKIISDSIELLPLPSKYRGAYRPLWNCVESILSHEVNCYSSLTLLI